MVRGSSSHAPRLRTILLVATVAIALLAVLVSGALVILTHTLHRTTTTTASSVESVRLLEEAQIALLLHGRARDLVVKREFEADLRRNLEAAHEHVTSPAEQRLLDQAERQVDAYLARSRRVDVPGLELAADEETAYTALAALVTFNVEESRQQLARANRWDEVGNRVGLVTGIVVIGVAGALVLWLRKRAFEPLLALASKMERFSHDREIRAQVRGAAELRMMSERFNEMATTIAAQRQAQIAFLGGVAHDLRNPLSSLRLAIDLVQPEGPLPPEPALRRTLALVDRQIGHLDRMVGDFLDIAKVEAGQLELRRAPHDLRTLVREALDLFDDPRRSQIQLGMPEAEVRIDCDSLRISQVITNLVSNAVKYSPAGGRIDVRVLAAGADALVEVIDHGIGMSPEDQRQIFEPFRRVGLAKDAVPGVGLGLFTVRRIVEAHAGRIEVTSSPGRGSTFRVQLPLLVSSHAVAQTVAAGVLRGAGAIDEGRTAFSETA